MRSPFCWQFGESTTLAQIAAEMSKQTGLKIDAAAYLGKHRLNLQCDGDSAEAILKTLADMNDWQWQEVEKGTILISRAPGRRPQKVGDLPAALQRAIPKDARRYLHFGTENKVGAVKRLTTAEGVATQRERLTLAFQKVGSKSSEDHTNAGASYAIQTLVDTLQDGIRDSKPIPFRKLSAPQQNMLIACHVLAILQMLDDQEAYRVTHDCLNPCFVDLMNLYISLPGSTLTFMSFSPMDGQLLGGIGAEIDRRWFTQKVFRNP